MTSRKYTEDDPEYHDSMAPTLYGITFSVLGLTIPVIIARLYCRFRLVKKMQWSDYLIIVAFVLVIAMSGVISLQIETGMGRRKIYSEDNPEMFRRSMKAGYSENILYQASLGFVKSSILMQYLYIASSVKQRRVIIAVLIFVIAAGMAITISAIFQCIPISAAFDVWNFPKHCWNLRTANYITSSINTATDVIIFLLPIPILAKLTMEKRKKVMLLGVFSIGSVAIIASAARLSNIRRWTNDNTDDWTYDASMIPVWGAVEVNVAIISASLPLLKPLLRRLIEHNAFLHHHLHHHFLHHSGGGNGSLAVHESWIRRAHANEHARTGAGQEGDPLDWDWDGEANALASTPMTTVIAAEKKPSVPVTVEAGQALAQYHRYTTGQSAVDAGVEKDAGAANMTTMTTTTTTTTTTIIKSNAAAAAKGDVCNEVEGGYGAGRSPRGLIAKSEGVVGSAATSTVEHVEHADRKESADNASFSTAIDENQNSSK